MKEQVTPDPCLIERESPSSTFKDFAEISLEDLPKQKKHRGGVGTHFPTLLHLVLTRAEKDGYGHICSWQPHGRCFAVHNRELFVQEVMPQYFRQSQYASFQRQLNLYGFQRCSQKSLDHGSYYHEMFLRTRADLCQGILRSNEKDLRALKAVREEPDFHQMTRMPPITEADIQATERVLMQQKTGDKESRLASAIEDSFTLPKPSEDPLANLFKSIMNNGIDASDSWMEPRPIAPGQGAQCPPPPFSSAFQFSQQPFALPKPEPLPLPSFLNGGGSMGPSETLTAPASSNAPVHPIMGMNLPQHQEAQLTEKRPLVYNVDLEERLAKRQADESNCLDWVAKSRSIQDDMAGMAGFLKDVDFD